MKHILPINEGWAFVKGCETAPAAIPAGAARVDLPHCWNALDGQDGGSDYWRGPCCYLKTIEKPAGKNVYVEVEAASSVGKIIVNGVEKASHKGGYSLFRANVTDALHDGENLLAIWVDNTQRDDVYPQTADFTFYGGLYRGVNLITVEDSRFDLDYCGGKGFDVSAAVEPLSLWTRSSQTPSRARALSSSSATPQASSWPAPCVRLRNGCTRRCALKTPTCGRA